MGCSQSGKRNDLITGLTVVEQLELTEHPVTLTETEDKRLGFGSGEGNIAIFSFNESDNKWNRDIYIEPAHEGIINSLCTLKGNRLLSGGCDDYLIKVWALSKTELTLLQEIEEHTSSLNKVIPLSKERFATCSNDHTVKIWKDDDTYECITTLQHTGNVTSIVQLPCKEVLVSSFEECDGEEENESYPSGIAFRNTKDYSTLGVIEGYSAYLPCHMIALPNDDVALSFSRDEQYFIAIFDSSSYKVKKEIYLEEYIIGNSCLYVLNDCSFVYVYKGICVQISSEDYSILFKYQGEECEFIGFNSVITFHQNKYLAIYNQMNIAIAKLTYA